ncbi:hypothetical protein ACFL2K_01965 [Candidatus Margulisiibacteriota bacterium]
MDKKKDSIYLINELNATEAKKQRLASTRPLSEVEGPLGHRGKVQRPKETVEEKIQKSVEKIDNSNQIKDFIKQTTKQLTRMDGLIRETSDKIKTKDDYIKHLEKQVKNNRKELDIERLRIKFENDIEKYKNAISQKDILIKKLKNAVEEQKAKYRHLDEYVRNNILQSILNSHFADSVSAPAKSEFKTQSYIDKRYETTPEGEEHFDKTNGQKENPTVEAQKAYIKFLERMLKDKGSHY